MRPELHLTGWPDPSEGVKPIPGGEEGNGATAEHAAEGNINQESRESFFNRTARALGAWAMSKSDWKGSSISMHLTRWVLPKPGGKICVIGREKKINGQNLFGKDCGDGGGEGAGLNVKTVLPGFRQLGSKLP